MTPQFTKEDRKIVTDFIAKFNKMFGITKVADAHKFHFSEFYVWNKFTIQVRAIDNYSTLSGFSVEIFFDSERLDYKNKTVNFGTSNQEIESALTFCKKLYEENTNSLLVCVLSDSD